MKNSEISKAALFIIAAFFCFAFYGEEKKPGLFRKGTVLTWTTFEKDVPQAKTVVRVMKVYRRKDTLFSESNVSYFDLPGEHAVGYGEFHCCRDSVSFISAVSNLGPKRMRFDNVESARFEGKPLVYPLHPDSGQTLTGTHAIIHYFREGEDTDMGYEVINRKIGAHDSLQTPAGKFDCWIIASEEHIDSHMTNPQLRRVTEWYCPYFGVVKMRFEQEGKETQEKILTEVRF
jgi:hypothetical protein